MVIIDINGENVEQFATYMGQDMAENLGREFYHGIAVMSDSEEEFLAGIVWEYMNMEDKADTESVIEWLKILDPEATELLFSSYKDAVSNARVVRSKVVIPVEDSQNEKKALKDAGFKVRLTEGDHIIVNLSELSALPFMASRKVPGNIRVLNELPLRQFRKGMSKCVEIGKKGICEDLSYLSMNWFEADVSCFAKTDDTISGFFLFHKLPSEMLSMQLMVGMDKNAQQNLLGMMRLFVISMEEKYSPDTKILLDRHNQASLMLSEKLLPRSFGIPVYSGSREEA